MITKKCLSKDGYIINQGILNTIPYGKYTSDYNGCGWIATYNAMKIMGKKANAKKVIKYLNHYTILKGKLGTNPMGVKKLLKDKSFKLTCTSQKRKFDSYSKNSDAAIILYWGNKYCHYVTFHKSADKYHFYNDIYGKEEDLRTMDEFLHDNKVKLAYLIGINH